MNSPVACANLILQDKPNSGSQSNTMVCYCQYSSYCASASYCKRVIKWGQWRGAVLAEEVFVFKDLLLLIL